MVFTLPWDKASEVSCRWLLGLQLTLCSFGGFGGTACPAPYPWIPCLYMRGYVCVLKVCVCLWYSYPQLGMVWLSLKEWTAWIYLPAHWKGTGPSWAVLAIGAQEFYPADQTWWSSTSNNNCNSLIAFASVYSLCSNHCAKFFTEISSIISHIIPIRRKRLLLLFYR